MGLLKHLVIHCTFTPPEMDVTKRHLWLWHFDQNGWDRYGYTDLLKRDGSIINLTKHSEDQYVENYEMTWGAKGFNSISRHVCLEGGKLKDNITPTKLMEFFELFTESQYFLLQNYVKDFLFHHHEHADIAGHNNFTDKKLCPGFDVQDFLPLIGVPEENIYIS